MKARTYLMSILILAVGTALAAPPEYGMERRPESQRYTPHPVPGYRSEVAPPYPDRPGGPPGGYRPDYRPGPPPVIVQPYGPGMYGPPPGPRHWAHRHPRPMGWYRPAMRAFRFCQSPRGATMTLQDTVLFATGKSNLRPGALNKLEPLAAWLADNPGVQVAIDGHTDDRASDAYNQTLSTRRAESVHAALVNMGASNVQYTVAGHGKRNPIATNATAAGMQRNRRVEVTLLGQQAASFGGMVCR